MLNSDKKRRLAFLPPGFFTWPKEMYGSDIYYFREKQHMQECSNTLLYFYWYLKVIFKFSVEPWCSQSRFLTFVNQSKRYWFRLLSESVLELHGWFFSLAHRGIQMPQHPSAAAPQGPWARSWLWRNISSCQSRASGSPEDRGRKETGKEEDRERGNRRDCQVLIVGLLQYIHFINALI